MKPTLVPLALGVLLLALPTARANPGRGVNFAETLYPCF